MAVMLTIQVCASCDDIFERDISGEQVEIIAPSDGMVVMEGKVTFSWNVLRGAEFYRLVVVGPSFDKAMSALCDEVIIADSAAMSCSHTFFLTAGNCQWTLQGVNSIGSSKRIVYGLSVKESDDN